MTELFADPGIKILACQPLGQTVVYGELIVTYKRIRNIPILPGRDIEKSSIGGTSIKWNRPIQMYCSLAKPHRHTPTERA